MHIPDSLLTPKQRQSIQKAMAKLPPISVVVQRILVLTTDPATTVDELASAVEGDQVLAAKVIRLVNSPFFGLDREVTSIRQAVIFLGFNTIRQLVMSVSFGYAFEFVPRAELDRFWRHSLAVAILSRRIAELVPGMDADRLFASGLLHDLGHLVLLTAFPEEYRQIIEEASHTGDISTLEREHFGIDHADVGLVLGTEWNFPAQIVDAIYYHHKVPPVMCGPELPRLEGRRLQEVEIVALSDYLSILTAHGIQGIPEMDPCWSRTRIYEHCKSYMPPAPEMVGFLHRDIVCTIENYGAK